MICTCEQSFDAQLPNGLPISAASASQQVCQKPNDLVREAVGCMGLFGGSRWW